MIITLIPMKSEQTDTEEKMYEFGDSRDKNVSTSLICVYEMN